jgi:hypothetical protein
MIEFASRRATPSVVVAVLRGDVRELDAVRSAAVAAEALGLPLAGCPLPAVGPALGLIRSLCGSAVGLWLGWVELQRELARGGVRCLLVAAETWRSAGPWLWPLAERCALVIQRRAASGPPRHVMLAADSLRTNRVLADWLAEIGLGPLRVTVAYATVPPWASSLAATMGWPIFVTAPPLEPRLPWAAVPPGAEPISVQATPLWGIRSLVAAMQPDLLVLGVHRHRFRLPLLAHPTAWALSREGPASVALCPMPGPR